MTSAFDASDPKYYADANDDGTYLLECLINRRAISAEEIAWVVEGTGTAGARELVRERLTFSTVGGRIVRIA